MQQAKTACRQHAGGDSLHSMAGKDGAALVKVGWLALHLEGWSEACLLLKSCTASSCG